MHTFVIHNPSKQHACFYFNGKPITVPMKDSLTVMESPHLEAAAFRAALERDGRKLGLTYQETETV